MVVHANRVFGNRFCNNVDLTTGSSDSEFAIQITHDDRLQKLVIENVVIIPRSTMQQLIDHVGEDEVLQGLGLEDCWRGKLGDES